MTEEVKCIHYWVLDSEPTRKGYFKVCRTCGEEGYDPYVSKVPSLYPEQKKKLVTRFLSGSNGSLPKRLDLE